MSIVESTQSGELSRRVELSYLFDFYGALLKEEHQNIFEDYVLNDLSLGEIASMYDITRQGIYDIVKRSTKKLTEYEAKLHLVLKFQETKDKLKEIESIANQNMKDDSMLKIEQLTKEIYDII